MIRGRDAGFVGNLEGFASGSGCEALLRARLYISNK